MSDQLRFEQADGVLRAQVDAGPGNHFTPEMAASLAGVLDTPPEGVHVVHLRASGSEFCTGRAPFRQGAGALSEDVAGLAALNRALARSPAVSVAEIQGDAAGFGVGLVVHCDVAIASPQARFSFPEVDSGFAPALVLGWLGALVGHRRAFWLTATGVQISAREACDLGLINDVADSHDELGATVASAIETLLSKPAAVHRDIKRLMRYYDSVPGELRADVAVDRLVLGALRRADAR